MSGITWFAATFALVTLATYAMCRPGWKRWAVVFLGITATVPLVWLLLGEGLTAFRILKTLSVAAAGILITLIRRFPERLPVLAPIVWGIFVFNILQASAVETLSHNILNPLAGALLCFAISAPRHASAEQRRVDWDFGWPFIVVYTIWNFVFVYSSAPPNEVPAMWSGLSLIHLGVPLLLSMRDSRRWAEARVVALYICVLLLDNAPGEPFIYASYWFDPDAAGVMQIVSFLAACGLLARAARPEVRLATPARWIGRRLLRAHR